MKLHLNIILFSLVIISISSCEDVINVDLQTDPARLTIEASLDWEKGTAGNNQTIKLSTSTPYFDTNSNTGVTGASVMVINDTNGAEFIFTDQNNGAYTTSDFVPVLNQSYTLEVLYNGENYTATETLMPVPDIASVTQSLEEGVDDEILDITITFTDSQEEGNNYLLKFKEEGDLLPFFDAFNDEFVNGNEINAVYEKEEDEEIGFEEFVPGDIVNIDLFGISEDYYNFMSILIEQLDNGGLFGTTPVTLKGNCINQNNPDNYANGYFRLTEVVRIRYTFQ